MKDVQSYYVRIIGVALVVVAIVIAFWLPLRVMLYGGIMQAVNSWGTDNAAVVWGIIRAVFFEFGFVLPYLIVRLGVYCYSFG